MMKFGKLMHISTPNRGMWLKIKFKKIKMTDGRHIKSKFLAITL